MPEPMSGENIVPSKSYALHEGYWVALCLQPNTAPLRCYVGVVQEIDETGVRITLVDWFIGTASGHDFFAPWASITSALVATPDDNLDHFTDEARKWQQWMKDKE